MHLEDLCSGSFLQAGSRGAGGGDRDERLITSAEVSREIHGGISSWAMVSAEKQGHGGTWGSCAVS